MNYWPLLGVAAVVLGLVLRLNPVLVVTGAGLITGFAAGLAPLEILAVFGESFAKNRYLILILLTLPVLGALERFGLREHAQDFIRRQRRMTTGRLLLLYLAVRQATAALGLTSLGGQAQTVRPLLAPMAEGAALARAPALPESERARIRAMAAATDNVGLFFGEDIFLAFGAVLLIQSFYAEHGIALEPLHIALWGIPTALCAFAIHGLRLWHFDRALARQLAHWAETRGVVATEPEAQC